MTKGAAFVLGAALITAFGVLETIFPGRNTLTVPIIQTLAMLAGGYIGLQVANNGMRGKFFNADLYNAENPHEEACPGQEGGKK